MSFEEELQGGIRNAIERGVPVEKIVQTFINAGYSPSDVQSAARAATEGATSIAPQAPSHASLPVSPTQDSPMPLPATTSPAVPVSTPQPLPPSKPLSSPSSNSEEDKPSTGNFKIILLVVVLIVLLGALAASLLFREQILGMFA